MNNNRLFLFNIAVAKTPTSCSVTCENWQTEKRTVRERTSLMINNSFMSHAKFEIDDSNSTKNKKGPQTMYAHKFLLSLSSPVFYNIFTVT